MTDDHQSGDGRDVQDRATDRQHERAERVERIVGEFEARLEDRSYPVSSAELGTEYADQPIDLPNETESIGDAFDRLDEEYDSPAAAREARAQRGPREGERGAERPASHVGAARAQRVMSS